MRVFAALPLPDTWRAPLLLTQFLLPVPRRVAPENLHLTLCFFGEVLQPQLDDLDDTLSAIRAPGPVLRADGLGLFGGTRAHNLHLRIAPDPVLERLAARIHRAARSVGLSPEARRFVPHVTLARFRPEQADQSRVSAAVVTTPAPDLPEAAAPVFHLCRSVLRPEGPHYDTLVAYPLLWLPPEMQGGS